MDMPFPRTESRASVSAAHQTAAPVVQTGLALAASHCLCQQALDRVGSQSALSMLNAVFASRPGRDSWSTISRAYNTTVPLADGTSVRFVSRERPKLLMGADGRPAYLSVSCLSATYALSATDRVPLSVHFVSKARAM